MQVEEGVSGVCETVRGVEYCGVYKITKLYWIDCHMPTIRGVQHTGTLHYLILRNVSMIAYTQSKFKNQNSL